MPTTKSRRWCIPLAIRWFQEQRYDGPLELVVASEGDRKICDLMPDDRRVILYNVPGPAPTLGWKHNYAVGNARYDWIAKWDDDDWQSPTRLELTMTAALLAGAELVSTAPLLFHELDTGATWQYHYELERPWQPGNSLLFSRRIWKEVRFDDQQNSGIDTRFTWSALELTTGVTVDDQPTTVVMKHGQTTGIKAWAPEPPEFAPWDGDLEELTGGALSAFRTAWSLRTR
jgi:hypothetical protein